MPALRLHISQVNTWESEQIMAYGFAILAAEMLGYEVAFNYAIDPLGLYRRAGLIPDEGKEGEYLKKVIEQSGGALDSWDKKKYVYFVPEAWRNNKKE